MTAKQIKFFGTKRQKAGLRNRRSNTHRRGNRGRRRNQGGIISQAEHAAERAIHTVEQAAEDAIGAVTRQVNRGRRGNVGEILTVLPANPGSRRRKNKMAATRRANRRRNRVSNRSRVHNRRHNRSRNRNRGWFNPRHRRRTNPKVIVRYRNRRRNYGRHRRRNPNFLAGDAGKVVGILGGATVTGLIVGFLPPNLTAGMMGYLTTGVVAIVAGQVAAGVSKNKPLGNFVTIGGLLIVGLKLMNQFFPQLQLPFTAAGSGTAGMGLLTSSNFFVPQVNVPGSMATFVTPAGIPVPVAIPAAGMKGLGAQPITGLRSMRRVGRFR